MHKQANLTLLHLSDLQFGKHHTFFNSCKAGSISSFDTLQARIQEDLERVTAKYSLTPDFIVVTGDLVETGQNSEFSNVSSFLTSISKSLSIDKSRILITPGNHDINRKACEAYFAQCAADEETPKSPYKEKWRHYKRFYDDFFSDTERTFDLDKPYDNIEFASQKVAIGILNSTISESHLDSDHYGLIGEPQARTLAEQLGDKKNEGWFNILLLHHNVVRQDSDANDNLHDAEMLQRVIGNSVDLILHGHTHRGKIHWWSPSLPIIGTGSASVNRKSRPDDVPNQYQILHITGTGISRYCRAFAPDECTWIPDTRVSDTGIEEHQITFNNIYSAFPNSHATEQHPHAHFPICSNSEATEIPITHAKPTTSPPLLYCDLPPVVDVWVGRTKQLASLSSINSGVITVTGIGGQGKSALAAKYLEQWKTIHPNSFWDWRDCREEGDRFHTQIVGQIERLTNGQISGENLQDASTAALVKYLFKLAGHNNCLFVFDNVDQYVNISDNSFHSGVAILVNESLKARHNCTILLTCRPRITYPNVHFYEICLDGLSFEDVINLFEQRGVNTKLAGTLNTIHEVYTLTDGHPLWLNLLAIQISRNEKSSSKILEELRKGEADNRARSMLRPIWMGLNGQQQQVLRCMAEIPRPMDIEEIHSCTGSRLKTFNRFKRAFTTIQALSLIVKCNTDGNTLKFDLHPLVRSFIKTEYQTAKERLPYIGSIVCYLNGLITIISPDILSETSFDRLRIWSEKAELEIESGQMIDATETLKSVASRLVATGYSEELFRVGKRILDDFKINPHRYADSKAFESLFCLTIQALIEFGQDAVARDYLATYRTSIEVGTAKFIGLCELMTWVEWHLGNYVEAITWGKEGNRLKKGSSIDTTYDCEHNLALALRDSGRHQEALDFFLFGNSLDTLLLNEEENKDRDGSFWGNIGRCLMLEGQYSKAIHFLKRSAITLQKDKSSIGIKNQGYAAAWIGQCLEATSKPVEAYLFYRKARDIWAMRAPILSSRIDSNINALELLTDIHPLIQLGANEVERRCAQSLLSICATNQQDI